MPITTTNPIYIRENKMTALGDPTEDTDGVNRSFLSKRIKEFPQLQKIYKLKLVHQ